MPAWWLALVVLAVSEHPPAPAPPAEAPAPPAPPAPEAAPAPDASSKAILVPAPFGAPAEETAAAQRALVAALRAEIGERVLDVKSVIDAQLAASITASDLALSRKARRKERTPPPRGLARLMEQAHASSALLVDVRDTETVVYIFIGGRGPAAPIVRLKRKKRDPLDDAWAQRIARTVKARAGDALQAFEFEIDVAGAEVEDEAPAADADIKAEMAAERAEEAARLARLAEEKRRREQGEPFVSALLSGGGALRFLDESGPGAASLAPFQNGLVPTAGVYASLSPLRALVPSLRSSPYTDVTVEAAYRRGIWDVKDAAGKSCGYDDDDAFFRAGWRAAFVDNPWVPKVGAVAGVGIERVQFGCALPVPSTQYQNVAAGVRVTQPLLPRAEDNTGSPLELDLLAGGRGVLLAPDEGSFSAGAWGEGFLVARPFSFTEARAGVRYASAHTDVREAGAVALALDDARLSIELQVGVVF